MWDRSPRPCRAGGPNPGSAPRQEIGPMPDNTLAAQLMVIAKEPVPGRVKTRLTPAYTPAEAAELAEAALADTLAAVASVSVTRKILALAGSPGRWLPPGFDVIVQRGGGGRGSGSGCCPNWPTSTPPARPSGSRRPRPAPGSRPACGRWVPGLW